MKKVNNIKELQELLNNDTTYGIDLPNGQCIGLNSVGCPLFYESENYYPKRITWSQALTIYNKSVTQRTLIYDVSVEKAQAEISLIEAAADPDDTTVLISAWVGGTITMEEIFEKIDAYQRQ